MKTINRTPYSVNIPSSKELDNKYFNHSNWKGMCEDKNFIGIDQETFADCNNVYIDADSILKSRPSIKYTTNDSLFRVYKFGKYYVEYKYVDENNCSIRIVNTGVDDSLTNSWTQSIGSAKVQSIVQADEKIFVFVSDGNHFYFDTTTDIFVTDKATVESYFYLPITKAYVNNSKGTDAESPNELYTGYRERYDYSDDKQGTFTVSQFIANYLLNSTASSTKSTSLKIGDDEYNVNITQNIKDVLVQRLSGTFNEADIKKSCVVKGNVIAYSFTRLREITTENKKYDTYVAVSVDYGKSFNILPSLASLEDTAFSTALTNLGISEDGLLIYGLYTVDTSRPYLVAISIAPDESGTLRYTTWTNLFAANSLGSFANTAAVHVTSHDDFAWAVPILPSTNNKVEITFHLYQNGEHKSHSYVDLSPGVVSQTGHAIVSHLVHKGTIIHSAYKYYLQESSEYEYGIVALDLTNTTRIVVDSLPTTVVNYLSSYVYGLDVYTVFGKTVSGKFQMYYMKNYNNETLISSEVYNSTKIIAYGVFNILTTDKLYNGDSQELLHDNVYPLSVSPLVYLKDGKLYSSALIDKATIIDSFPGTIQNVDFDFEAELSSYYFAKGKKLMISAAGSYQDKDFEWYMPERDTEYFDYQITNLHPISSTELAIFFEDSIYYTYYDANVNAHRFTKTRIPLGLHYGSEVVTTTDNKYTIFSTVRGLVAMNYQDFINSTEQALTYLSDNIFDKYNKWSAYDTQSYDDGVKLYIYNFWLICYRKDRSSGFVYDFRNGSWWPMTISDNEKVVMQLYTYKNDLMLLISMTSARTQNVRGYKYNIDKTSEQYYDTISGKTNIDWFIRSQKLHFSAINYYKHIVNMTISSVNDGAEEMNFLLKIINYRKEPTVGKNTDQVNREDTTVQVKVSMVRTFAKRLHYFKVSEFEYRLSNFKAENGQTITTLKPLSLTNITIRYTLTGQVR